MNKEFYNFNDLYGNPEWTSSDAEIVKKIDAYIKAFSSWPKEFNFLEYFLKAKIQVTADIWAKLGMKL
jgi:hypothetical protein